MNEPPAAESHSVPQRRLSLVDCVSIMIGIIIGAGIYETAPQIASNVSGIGMLLGVWITGGVLSLIGAACYAELATAQPAEGGDYVYLSRAFGPGVGFAFAWTGFWIVWPGNLGIMAYVFGKFADQLLPLPWHGPLIYAAGSIGLLTVVNILGLRGGTWTQNILTGAKLLGLGVLVFVGLFVSSDAGSTAPASSATPNESAPTVNFSLAMVLVLYAFGGWRDVSFVAAEVREPAKNLLRSLFIGVAAVTAIYLLVNAALLIGMGFGGLSAPDASVAQMMKDKIGPGGGQLISVLICISALGAINGMLLTGSRIFYAVGRDHAAFRFLGQWHAKFRTPVRSLLLQGAVTMGLVLMIGSGSDAFERMVMFSAPVYWVFIAMVGVALMRLRRQRKRQGAEAAETYRVPGYPITPIVFVLSSLFMLYSSITYAWSNAHPEAWVVLGVLATAVLMYGIARRKNGEKGA